MEAPEELIAVKLHETEKGLVLGACDKELLGKMLDHEGTEIKIDKDFFFGWYASPKEVLSHLETCFTANLFGKRTVGAYCRKNPESEEAVIHIGGVPHLQIFRI